MKIIQLKLDYLSYPIFGEYYSIEKHCTITKISVIDEDKVLKDVGNKMQTLYSSYFEFDSHDQACWFNKEQQIKDKPKMLDLLAKLKARLNEINDGSFEIEDLITPEYDRL
ncbi:MAG: RNA helicase [Clostridia bacterium]|nr:RNA helicase [Clostridia bacterium]